MHVEQPTDPQRPIGWRLAQRHKRQLLPDRDFAGAGDEQVVVVHSDVLHCSMSETDSPTIREMIFSPVTAVADLGSPNTPELLNSRSSNGRVTKSDGNTGYSATARSIRTASGASASIIDVSTSSA